MTNMQANSVVSVYYSYKYRAHGQIYKDNETEALKKRESKLYRHIGKLKYEVDWLKKI